jgi:hypothetical protein
MYQIKKELHPEIQRPEDQKKKCAFCMYPVYASNDGVSMLEVRNSNEMWRSEDNGKTWALLKKLQVEEKISDTEYYKWSYGPIIHDPFQDKLIRFEYHNAYKCPVAQITDYYKHCEFVIPESTMNYYRISCDGGITWSKKRQFIQYGPEFDENNYSERHTKDSGFIQFGEIPPYMVVNDGTLMLPIQGRSSVNSDTEGTIQAGRFFGKWDEVAQDYKWHVGGYVPGGGCEQTIVRLKDGRLLNILRTQGNIEPYYFDLRYRPYSISEDDGKSWSKPEPLCWDEGGCIISPRAWSQLIRAQNGKLYWIANILPDNENTLQLMKDTGRADPRYPLVIAEADEKALTLKRNTATTIIDRGEGETKFVRFSNFCCYNDRATGEIVMYMQKSYHENQPDLENMPHPAWRFRIKV